MEYIQHLTNVVVKNQFSIWSDCRLQIRVKTQTVDYREETFVFISLISSANCKQDYLG